MAAVQGVDRTWGSLEQRVFAPLQRTSRGFYVWVGFLLIVVAWAAYAYSVQARDGLIATGMRDRIMWGLYVTLFVYFIGASMAGTFVSAVLRLTKAKWRGPIVRGAEIMTVSALIVAALFIMFDIGRPMRAHNILLFGRWESPLVWDVYGLSTYLTGSFIYLYLAMIPDLALVRDRLWSTLNTPRRIFFDVLSIGWAGTPGQVRVLASATGLMTIVMIPVAVMMHTVTSWIFGMTLREPWNSPMFGIFFVGGAVYSGIGLIVILMVILRRVYHLEDVITKRHFLNLGYMLAAFAAIMVFFNVSEFVTLGYKLSGDAAFNIHQMTRGEIAPLFWIYIWAGLVLPIAIIILPATRNMTGVLIAAIAANFGMFLERYFIVVGGLRVPLNPYEPANYSPSWVEWSLMAGGIAIFALMITIVLKLVPALAIFEMREQTGAVEIADGGAPVSGRERA